MTAAAEVMDKFDTAEKSLMVQKDIVDKEIQFNTWLFDHLAKKLQPLGFTVDPNKMNKSIKPNVNEYSCSKPDCIIWHPNGCRSIAVSVTVDEFDEVESYEVSGEVIEMKSSQSLDEAAITECYCNMFGCTTLFILCKEK